MGEKIVNNYLNQIEAMRNLARKKNILPVSLDLIIHLGVKNSKEIPTNDFLNEIISNSDLFKYKTLVRTAVAMLKAEGYVQELNCNLPENKEKNYFELTRKGRALYKRSIQALENSLKA